MYLIGSSNIFLWDVCTNVPYYFHALVLFQACKWSELVLLWDQWYFLHNFFFQVLKQYSGGMVLRTSVRVTAIYEHKRFLIKQTISTVNTRNNLKLCEVESKYPQSNCVIELPEWICMEKIKSWRNWSAWTLLVIFPATKARWTFHFSVGFIEMDLSSEPWISTITWFFLPWTTMVKLRARIWGLMALT